MQITDETVAWPPLKKALWDVVVAANLNAEYVKAFDFTDELYRAALAALPLPEPVAWQPTHRHIKRGSTYSAIGPALLQASAPCVEPDEMMVYRAESGELWVRPLAEFTDGRFEALTTPPAPLPSEEDDLRAAREAAVEAWHLVGKFWMVLAATIFITILEARRWNAVVESGTSDGGWESR